MLREFSMVANQQVPIFTDHHMFQGLPSAIVSDPKWARHVRNKTRGRGYWFWKPALINNLLAQGKIIDGDVVVWHDPDETAYMDGKRWSNLITKEGGWDIFIPDEQQCERSFTKGDVFKKFNVSIDDPQYGRSAQVHAFLSVFHINEKTRKFLKHWEDLMTDFHIISDEPSISPENEHFMENRHDQSVLSLLSKANRAVNMDGAGRSILAGCSGNGSLRPEDIHPKLHPKYGVPGLNVKVNDLNIERAGLEGAALRSPWTASSFHERKGARRDFCTGDTCFNLDDKDSAGRLAKIYG